MRQAMRIGEILVKHGWVDRAVVLRALSEQPATRKRICSLLISRGVLDPDLAARALAQQHDVAAILQHHLAKRDRSLAALLPASIARGSHVLPVGRLASGDLIVCARDPRPDLAAMIARAVRQSVVIAVAPASQLEELIDLTYEPVPEESDGSIDVDMNTGPIAIIPDLGSLSLVELDDSRVAKDHTQSAASGQYGVPRTPAIGARAATAATLPPTNAPVSALRAAALGRSTPGGSSGRPEDESGRTPGSSSGDRRIAPPSGLASAFAAGSGAMPARLLNLQEALVGITEARTRDAAADAALGFVAGRWSSSLLVVLRDGFGYGQRGHGGELKASETVRAVAMPLSQPSLLRAVYTSRRLITEPPPPGPLTAQLARLLGDPKWPMAAPITAGSSVAGVLVVGDTINGDDSEADLALVAATLGTAFSRCPS